MINTGNKGFIQGTTRQANPYDGGGTQNKARALGSLGVSISNVGKQGEQVLHQLLDAKNAKLENETVTEWENAFAKYEAETMGNKDPEDRISKLDGMFSTLKQQGLDNKSLPANVRERLEAQWGRMSSRYKNRALSQASQLMVEQDNQAFGLRLDKALQNGTMEDVKALLAERVAQNRMSPQEAQNVAHKLEGKIRDRDFETILNSDPFRAEQMLDSFGYSDLDKSRRMKKIERAKKVVENDSLKNYNMLLESGRITNESDMTSQVDKLPVGELTKEILKRNWMNDQPLSEEEKGTARKTLRTELQQYMTDFHDPSKSKEELEDQYEELRQEMYSYPSEVRNDMQGELNRYTPEDWLRAQQSGATSKQKEWLSTVAGKTADTKKYVNNLYKTAAGEDIIDEATGKKASDLVLDTYAMELSEDMEKIEGFIFENPEASPQDIKSFARDTVISRTSFQDALKRQQELKKQMEEESQGEFNSTSYIPAGEYKSKYGFKVFTGSRDEIKNFKSTPSERKIALDFNDAEDKRGNQSGRGMEIVLPKDATSFEIAQAKQYIKQTHKLFKKHGIDIPIRQGGQGVKIGGGKAGVIHTEPFFARNKKALDFMKSEMGGKAYSSVLASTLGQIKGSTFIAPHTKPGAKDSNPGEGATSYGISERQLALQYILPHLSS